MNYFITYGDIYFEQAKVKLIDQARKIGFTNCRSYSPLDLSKTFINATSKFIHLKKGGGIGYGSLLFLKIYLIRCNMMRF